MNDHLYSAVVPIQRKERMLKPTSSGIFERIAVIGGGLAIAYTCAATAPIASLCAIGMIGLSFIKEIKEFQHPEKSKALEEILNARTVKHPSIWESRKALKAQYPVHAINQAIEAMIGNCHWYSFKRSDDHPLAGFGECYCYVDPEDGEVMLPIQAIEKMLKHWQVEPTIDVESTEVEGQQKALPVGNHTRLTAVEVPVIEETEQVELLNVPEFIVDNIYSYAIIGPSGAGKGMLVSHVVREYKKRWPNRPVILIDPKNDPKESGYWEGIVDVWHRGNFRKMEISEKSDWLNEALDIIRDTAGPHLAILDEATMLFGFAKNCDRALSNRLKDTATSTASGGNSEEEYLCIVGHSGNLDDYGITGGLMQSFKTVYIAPGNNLGSILQLGNTKFTGETFNRKKAEEIAAIANESPVNRAVYLGVKGEWFPMAELTNYSGYNRDERQFMSNPVEVQPMNEPTPVADSVDVEFEVFVAQLIATLKAAASDGKDVGMLTPEKILASKYAPQGLTLEKAKIALERAMNWV